MMTQRIRSRALLLLLLIPCLNGCVLGTVFTRTEKDSDVVGRYPLQALAVDFDIMTEANPHMDLRAMALISLPLDLVIDVALLPVDLVLWPFGFSK